MHVRGRLVFFAPLVLGCVLYMVIYVERFETKVKWSVLLKNLKPNDDTRRATGIFRSTCSRDFVVSKVPASDVSNTNSQNYVIPMAHIITPTYARVTQVVDLLRLCSTLMNVRNIHWIVVEDSTNKTELVTRLLSSCKGPVITHLNAKTPANNTKRHRGVEQRNTGLAWIRQCVLPGNLSGGVYFGDDDNTYDAKLFDAVRNTKKVSAWKVGFVASLPAEGPLCSNGKVTGFVSAWHSGRTFPVDMAAFAVNTNFLLKHSEVTFQHDWPPGHLENKFLKSLGIKPEDLTPGPDANCSQIVVWHTKTVKPNVHGRGVNVTIKKRPQPQKKGS